MSTQTEQVDERREDRAVGISIVQESSGSLRVTIPAEVAEEITIDAGDSVFVTSDSEDEFRARKSSSVDL
ncbi:AbrB/MazE/SpoVT family DNA-binding domain-containing protein [Halobellus inordinatus]|uniref:AbrB/MazE/SpoVT family DNA-binding domain-containing protein n=1 Tax=Halobellus inordinatus TaxID=1126236 RepID=UPI002114D0FD|nr:AbrB/MazE/SpoVT family DNA-binding domain-containing protein [Halobellus ramosii]